MNKITSILSIIALIALLSFSYLKNKAHHDFNPNKVLLTSNQRTFMLKDFKNNIVLIYFGFLSCPEACPTTLNTLASSFKNLTYDQLNNLTVLFIDLDNERDSIEKMIEYTNYFDKKIIPIRIENTNELK
jgi:protein SCO1/2